MPKRELVIYPDPLLRESTQEVTEFGKELHQLLDDMAETMYEESGIGLAAPQVGVLSRVTVIDVSSDRDSRIELINPTIVEHEGEVTSEEGCLSIPDYRDSVSRAKKILFKAFDRFGKPFEMEADDLFSICVQHELDHLDGVLFVDRLSRLKKEMFKKWFKKHGPLS